MKIQGTKHAVVSDVVHAAFHNFDITFILTYPLTTKVDRAPQMLHNQFLPFFSVLHCPLGLSELQACPFPDVVFQPLLLSALSSSPFHCTLQDGFGQT